MIPVYNGAGYVGEAISSVLAQTLKPLECIVVDDGSTDATAAVVSEYGREVKYVYQENRGVSLARNRGAAEAVGDVLAFLDHDDAWLPHKLERQLAELRNGEAMLVICAMSITDASGVVTGERRLRATGNLAAGMLMFDGTEVPSCSSTGVIWKNAFHQLGGFDLRLGTSADWDLLFNAVIRGWLGYVDEPLVRYRVHGENMSRSVPAMEHDMLYAYRKAFADPRLPASLRDSRRRAYAQLYRMLSGSYNHAGDNRNALRTAVASLLNDPRPIAGEFRRFASRGVRK